MSNMLCSINYNFSPSNAFSSGVSSLEMPADILNVRFLLGGGFAISLSRFAAIATRSSPTVTAS